jgi:hypothetical protein
VPTEPPLPPTTPATPATLDLESSRDAVLAASDQLPDTVSTEPYNSEKARDKARENIAYALIGILAGTILATLALSGWLLAPGDADGNADRLVRVLNIIFGPIITLVGSATGFYFGAQTASRPKDESSAPQARSKGAS